MIKNYFATTLRSLIRQRTYLVINLAGLAVGIAAFIMIMIFVAHEKSFDQNITQRDRMYRVVEIQNVPGVGSQQAAVTMGPLAQELKNTFPQVKETVRIMPAFQFRSVRNGNKIFRESNMFFTDPSIIDMFSIRLLKGNPKTAIREPHTILLSKKIAEKYFGTVDRAYNSILMLDNVPYKVDAIMEDQPDECHLRFDILASMSSVEGTPDFKWMKEWGSNSMITYVLLDNKEHKKEVEAGLPAFIKAKIFAEEDAWEEMEMYLQPVNDIYLRSQHIKFQMVSKSGDSRIVLVFIVIAILILLIACVNYINISLARSVKRAREVGIRKVLGADRMSLFYRYISESFIITLIAILFSIGLLELLLPGLNNILGTSFVLDFTAPVFIGGLLALLIVISLISGAYPALYLSRFQPITVLKGDLRVQGKSGYLSKILMVFQFACSIGLIFSILMINDQIRFIQNKDLGIDYANSVFVYFGQDDYKKLDVVKSTLLENPAIRKVSGSSYYNGVSSSQALVYVDSAEKVQLAMRYGFVDEDFFDAMGVKIVQGRNFDKTIQSDSGYAVIFNQNAMDKLGWKDINGRRMHSSLSDDSTKMVEVIGVINDYNYFSLKSAIEPAAYYYIPQNFRGVTIKYSSQISREDIEGYIQSVWADLFPQTPVQLVFSEESVADNYKSDYKVRSLFVYFAIISLFLSCLGLYGLTALLIEQKTKTIGIRKVLGSPVYLIIYNLVKEYLILVLLSGVIAIPLAVMFMNRFLSDFPYHVSIRVFNILAAIMVVIIIAFMTVVVKAGKIAGSNALESLKYE